MNENIKVNNKKKQMDIFKSLLAIEIRGKAEKSQQEINAELKQLEKENKLRIYYPERGDHEK